MTSFISFTVTGDITLFRKILSLYSTEKKRLPIKIPFQVKYNIFPND